MQTVALTVKIQTDQSLVMLRQRGRQISELFGLDALQRTRLTTAVSEIGRNALQYAGTATTSFLVGASVARPGAQSVLVRVTDKGPGIPPSIWTGSELVTSDRAGGLQGSQRLVDAFWIETRATGGSTVSMEMLLPRNSPWLQAADISQRIDELFRRRPDNAYEDLEQQNRDMLHALEELRQRKRELEIADQRKNEFVAMLAHELRNPLAAISMSVEVMRRKKNLQMADVEKYRDTIARQSTQLTRLVNDLMDVSRVSRGKVELERAVASVHSLIFEAVEMTQAYVDAKNHRLQMPALEPVAWVDVDLVRMKQVMSNLLHNAARYTPAGGLIEISITLGDAVVDISVKDNGVGIDAAMLPKIFDMFTQASNSLAREDSGLGVGLTIVQRMVQDHGGTIRAHSAGLGLGSEFVLSLPTVTPPAEDSAAPTLTAPDSDISRPQRLLLVDDNADALHAMAELFRLHGYDCVVADDGLKGLAAAAEHPPHIAIIDIGLPGLDGFGLAAELRRMYGAGMTLIAMSGYSGTDTRLRAEQAGFDDLLIKPLNVQAVLQRLQDAPVARWSDRQAPGGV